MPAVFAMAWGVVAPLFAVSYSNSGAVTSSLCGPAVVKQVERRRCERAPVEGKTLTRPLGVSPLSRNYYFPGLICVFHGDLASLSHIWFQTSEDTGYLLGKIWWVLFQFKNAAAPWLTPLEAPDEAYSAAIVYNTVLIIRCGIQSPAPPRNPESSARESSGGSEPGARATWMWTKFGKVPAHLKMRSEGCSPITRSKPRWKMV